MAAFARISVIPEQGHGQVRPWAGHRGPPPRRADLMGSTGEQPTSELAADLLIGVPVVLEKFWPDIPDLR